MTKNSVPLILQGLESWTNLSHLLKENNHTSVCTLETALEKIQKKDTVMRPLSKLWHALASATTTPEAI